MNILADQGLITHKCFTYYKIYRPQGYNQDTRTLKLTFCFSLFQKVLKTKDFLSIFFSFSMENNVLILIHSNTLSLIVNMHPAYLEVSKDPTFQ